MFSHLRIGTITKGLVEKEMETPKVSQFRRKKYICIESYRKNGQPVKTPVWFVEENGVLYVHTSDDTGKVKRIRRNPKVRIAVCNFRGNPKGDWTNAKAELMPASKVDTYHPLIIKKYGLMAKLVRFMDRFSRSKAQSVILAIHT
jgi:PPOX class probable F420-dependent enzyme